MHAVEPGRSRVVAQVDQKQCDTCKLELPENLFARGSRKCRRCKSNWDAIRRMAFHEDVGRTWNDLKASASWSCEAEHIHKDYKRLLSQEYGCSSPALHRLDIASRLHQLHTWGIFPMNPFDLCQPSMPQRRFIPGGMGLGGGGKANSAQEPAAAQAASLHPPGPASPPTASADMWDIVSEESLEVVTKIKRRRRRRSRS